MPALQRSTVVRRGPRFWLGEEGKTMFELVLDGSTRFGPREATGDDKEEHQDAYERFLGGDEGGPSAGVTVRAVDPEVKPAPPPKPHAERRATAAAE